MKIEMAVRMMSEKPDNYEVEVFVKDNKIIVMGKIRPINLCVRPLGVRRMSEKRFRKVMGFIQDNTCEKGDIEGVMDLTEIEDMLNELCDENKQLKEEIRAYPINEEYAEEIMQQNQKLRIERNDLRIENEKLKKKLECCEYSHFLNELDEIHEKVDKGDLSDLNPLKEDEPLNDYNPLKEDLYYWQCKYFKRDYEHKRDMCTRCNYGGLLNYCLKDKCDKMVKKDYEVTVTYFNDGVSIGWKKR